MYNFSIFVDDSIAPDLAGKIQLCGRLQLGNMEIGDKLEGQYIADMNGRQLEALRGQLIWNNKKLVLMNLTRPVSELEYYKRLFRKASILGVEYVNLVIGNEETDNESFIRDFAALCKTAEAYGLFLLIENRADGFLSDDKAVAAFYGRIKTGNTGLIFNPLEYARIKSHPFFHEFYNSRLKNKIKFLRVNDGLFIDGRPTLPALGNGEIKELASILLSRGFKGYFSFTPYMEGMDEGEYVKIIESFKKLLLAM